jgi:hypothetical protein
VKVLFSKDEKGIQDGKKKRSGVKSQREKPERSKDSREHTAPTETNPFSSK